MKTTRTTLVLLLLLAFTAVPAAQETPEPEPRLYNYLIYFNGARIGWARYSVKQAQLDGREVMHQTEEVWLQIRRSFDNSVFESASTAETWYETNGVAIRKIDVTRSGNQTERIETEFAKDSASITHTIDKGRPTAVTVKYEKHTVMCDMRAWYALKEADRLKAGERLEFHTVSESDHALVSQTWIINGRVKRKLADNSTVEGYEISVVKGGRASTLIFGDDDMPMFMEDTAGFTMERTKTIPEPFRAERISLRSTMRANVAIRQQGEIARMNIHFKFEHDDGDGVPPIADSNAYHDVVKYDEGYALRLKARKLADDFKGPALPLEDVPEDVARFLRPTPMSQSDDKVLMAEAEKLAKGKDSALEVSRAIMQFVAQRLKGGSGDTGSASARQAYDERQGDCTEHAALLVALARAAGIPARTVGGFTYVCSPGGTQAMFGFHAWAEVWLGEWVPVDSTVGELGTSARYVFFIVNEPGETHGRSRTSRCLRQGILPVIDSYELFNGVNWHRRGAREFKFD